MAHARNPDPRLDPRDSGYVLLATLWLLLLAAVLASAMLVTARQRSQVQHQDMGTTTLDHALDGAVVTVVADRLFKGGASQWSQLPASGVVMVDGVRVAIVVSDDAARVDLNAIAPAEIGAVLDEAGRRWGWPRPLFDAIRTRLVALRAGGDRLHSMRQLRQWIGPADFERVAEHMTLASGLSRLPTDPHGTRIDGAALAGLPTASNLIRLTAAAEWHGRSARQTVVVRIVGRADRPYLIHDRW